MYDIGTPQPRLTPDPAASPGQMLLELDAQGHVTHRYLWGPAVDQILADEQVDADGTGDTLWLLTDHLGTVRALAVYNTQTAVTAVVSHRVYDSFGSLRSATDPATKQAPAVDCLFAFTGRPLDPATGLQNHLHRWYDPTVGRWLSEDPTGFAAGDANLYRYVGNSATNVTDPSGLGPWQGIARILGKRWTKETCQRAAKALATELLQKLAGHPPDSQEAQEIIRALRRMGWVEEALGQGTKAGKTLAEGGGIILREMENGKPTGRILEWYPGGGPHHKDPHWKFSSGESGTLRTTVGGTVVAVAIAIIPGAAQAAQGDWNGAARDVLVEVTPLAWAKIGWQSLCSFFDSCERDLYGEEFHREMEEYRKEFWDKRK